MEGAQSTASLCHTNVTFITERTPHAERRQERHTSCVAILNLTRDSSLSLYLSTSFPFCVPVPLSVDRVTASAEQSSERRGELENGLLIIIFVVMFHCIRLRSLGSAHLSPLVTLSLSPAPGLLSSDIQDTSSNIVSLSLSLLQSLIRQTDPGDNVRRKLRGLHGIN